MKADVRALADAARGLLLHGDPGGAERVLSPVFRDLKSDTTVLHLMAMIKKAKGDLPEAERFVRAAIASDLKEGGYYSDLGVILQAQGKYGEAERVFRAAIILMDNAQSAYVNLVRCLLQGGEVESAEKEARDFIAKHKTAEAWTVLGQVQNVRGRYEDAIESAREAFRLAPNRRQLRHNLALALEKAGKSKEALEHFRALAEEGVDTPDLAVSLARALNADGQADEAEQVLIGAVRNWPHAANAHTALAKLRWSRGESDAATSYLEEAIERFPEDVSLALTCADLMNRAELHDRARVILENALKHAPDHPALLSSMGVVLDESGRVEEALKYLKRAAKLTPGVMHTHRNMIPTLLRAGDAEEALRLVRIFRNSTPEDQELIAYEALALRKLGDPAYRALYDYERLVKVYDLAAPRGYFSVENFNAGLAESLAGQLTGGSSPLDQTLRFGEQTTRSLLGCGDVNIEALLGAIVDPVRAYIQDLLAHPQDPVGRRKTATFRIQNCWATRLRSKGFHVNHVHNSGWISSAYYVALPDAKGDSDPKAGWLKFGEPRYETPGCAPEKFVEPKVGRLVLFPSYMWHGTVPFTGSGQRLSVAFDVIPG